jgi:cyclophilin family peptidyl-prolyl cis-trans isomerase
LRAAGKQDISRSNRSNFVLSLRSMKKLAPIFCGFCLPFIFQTTVLAQVIITNQPQSITINNASDATFSVGASNVLTYQWQFNGSNLNDGGNITGSTNAVLTLEDVTTNQAGSYTVILNNAVTSSNAALTIVPGTIVTFNFSGFIGGGVSNVQVQLFDHDKPATVQNFLHYIRAGAYTNMFFDRCETNFILQGGDYGTTDRTNTNSPMTGWDISSMFTTATNQPNPPFPPQVDSEFNVGPLIHNSFGTMATSIFAGEPNSAASAFFFNLTDNSDDLDFQSGGFTVFGRILNNSNVLAYFNTLADGSGLATNGEFFDEAVMLTNPTVTNLPVNYIGTHPPANADLVFCGFQLPTNAPVDTNPPTVAITSPAPNALVTNDHPVIQGTASDDVGLAVVICKLIPQPAPGGTYPNEELPITNYAIGTTNWSVSFTNVVDFFSELEVVPPGSYDLIVQAQDGAGNLSVPTNQLLTITTIVTNGEGIVTFTEDGTNYNAVGYPFQDDTSYNVVAVPGTNQVFVSWTTGDKTILSPALTFPMTDGLLLTATFVTNSLPDSIAFTYPPSNAIISTGTFNITGTISNVSELPVTVVCQIYSTSTLLEVETLTNSDVTSDWSVTASNLPLDSYAVEATAVDSASNSTVIIENFVVSTNAFLTLNIVGPGTVSGVTNGEVLLVGTNFQALAIPDPGQLFYTWSWSNATEVSLDPSQTFTMAQGLTLTATFVSNTMPNSITFTSPPANVALSNGYVQVGGTISNVPAPPVTVTCQIFSQSTLLAVSPPLTTSGTTNWSVVASNLVAGPYIAEVEAVDQEGNSTVVTNDFNAIVDTNLPVVSILHPATNAILADDNPLVFNGTASDSNGLAAVGCFLVPQKAGDGTYPNGGNQLFNYAIGTTNWTVDCGLVPPGVYGLDVEALDDVGNIGVQSQIITNTAILINGEGSVILMQGSNVLADPVGYPLQDEVTYKLEATPGAGQRFVGWSAGAYVTTNPVVSFVNAPGVLWTATFGPTNAGKGIAFTYPTANAGLKTNTFLLKGTIAASFKSAHISCQIASLTTSFGVGPLPATVDSTIWSAGVSNLPPDNYLLEAVATNGTGQSAIISEKFSVYAFTEVAGTYNGLFICTNNPVTPTNSGFLTFTVQPNGIFSGRLVFPAYATVPIFPTYFENYYFTSGYYSFSLPNFYGNPLDGTINLNLSAGTNVVFGTISSRAWSSQLICYREVTKLSTNTMPATGKYIFSLQPGNQTNPPNSNGYASVTIATDGILALSGALPDDSTYSESVGVSQDGVWPLYTVPVGYKTNGMLMGWETNLASNICSGQLYWYKTPHVGAYDTNGIDTNMNSTGTNYLPPVAGDYSIVFQGGTIDVPVTNNLTMARAGDQFVIPKPLPADRLAISLSASGILTGHFLNTNGNKTLEFMGAYLGQSQGGSGFILEGGGQTGYFTLEIEPP